MAFLLRALEGLAVTEVVELHGYLQLCFGDQIGVSIYNRAWVSPETCGVAGLRGKILSLVIEEKDSIEFKFRDGTRFTIDMRQQAYRGPEALQLNRKGLPPVVWRYGDTEIVDRRLQ